MQNGFNWYFCIFYLIKEHLYHKTVCFSKDYLNKHIGFTFIIANRMWIGLFITYQNGITMAKGHIYTCSRIWLITSYENMHHNMNKCITKYNITQWWITKDKQYQKQKHFFPHYITNTHVSVLIQSSVYDICVAKQATTDGWGDEIIAYCIFCPFSRFILTYHKMNVDILACCNELSFSMVSIIYHRYWI